MKLMEWLKLKKNLILKVENALNLDAYQFYKIFEIL